MESCSLCLPNHLLLSPAEQVNANKCRTHSSPQQTLAVKFGAEGAVLKAWGRGPMRSVWGVDGAGASLHAMGEPARTPLELHACLVS